MFIQTEATPNPQTLKFLPGRVVLEAGTADFPSAESGQSSPLARRLFEVEGVARVFFGEDFIAVTKGEAEWKHIKPALLSAIMLHFTTGEPVLSDGEGPAELQEEFDPEDAEIVGQIKELIETRVRPAVAQDGGDIVFRGFEGKSGTVFLHMRGACSGCPSSTATLRNGIEKMLKHYVPEVNAVEAVSV